MSACPPTPKSENKSELGFERRRMVAWFDPAQLARTGLKTALSSLFGAYSDKREMQAALNKGLDASRLRHDPQSRESHILDPAPLDGDYSDQEGDVWFDYMGDTGDGFNSTYTMAKILAEEKCQVEGETETLPRGRFLVLGGDQVYPAASREEYQNRFLGPFRAALPWVDEAERQPPHMFAIPGNHDWYDGLTSFIRLFCQDRWIGGWKTRQKFSYFAIKLPRGWWLWGIDLQLEADIDKPQLDYFRGVARDHVKEGDQIILCTGTPSWLEAASGDERGFANVYHFIKETLSATDKGQVRVILTGDLHHYCHYEYDEETSSPEQKRDCARPERLITSGGGGAYLYPTHRMPNSLSILWPPRDLPHPRDEKRNFRRKAVFPDDDQSRRLMWGALWLQFKNWWFGGLLATLYLLYAWLLQSVSVAISQSNETFIGKILDLRPWRLGDVGEMLSQFWLVFIRGPEVVILTALILLGLGAYAYSGGRKKWHWALGMAHGVAHIMLNLFLIWGFTLLNQWVLKSHFKVDGLWFLSLLIPEMFFFGGVFGGGLMGLYLLLCEFVPSRWEHTRLHTNEVYSAQSIPDYKNFLRLRIDQKGRLSIYAIGVRKIVKDWKLNPKAANGESWFQPQSKPPQAHIIERIEL